MSTAYGLQLGAAMTPPRLQYLPTELIKIVIDHLTLADTFTLSQVNSRLRAIATQDWRNVVSDLPRHKRIHFYNGLAHVRANHWVCDLGSCIRLHEIDPTDIPSNRPESRHEYDGFYHLYTPKPCKTDHIEVFGGAWTWGLREMHIQLALKLTRMLAGSDEIAAKAVKRAHLRKLMKPFKLKLVWKYSEPTRSGFGGYSDPSQMGLATPRIVDGRYILRMEWRCRNDDRRKMGWRAGSLNWSICPHQPCLSEPERDPDVMAILPYECGDRHTSYWGLSDAHKSYFSDDGPGPNHPTPLKEVYEMNKSCALCAVDWYVFLGPRQAIVRAWCDLGSERLPGDKMSAIYSRWGVIRNRVVGARSHVPGSARRMYERQEDYDQG